MKLSKYLILFLFLFPTFKTKAQDTDLEKLLWAYDIMYFNRVGQDLIGHYTDSAKCNLVLGKTIRIFSEIKNKDSLKKNHPFAFASTMAEYYALRASTYYLTQNVSRHKDILLSIDSLRLSLARSYITFNDSAIKSINDSLEIGSGNLINDRKALYNFYSDISTGVYSEVIHARTKSLTGNEYYDNDLHYLMDMIDILIDYRYSEKKGENINGLNVLNLIEKISLKVLNMPQIRESFPGLYKKYYSGYIKLKFEIMMEGKLRISSIDKIFLIKTLLDYGTPIKKDDELDRIQIIYERDYPYDLSKTPVWPEEFEINSEKELLLNLVGSRVHNLDRYSCLINSDSLKTLSNQFLADTMLKIYANKETVKYNRFYEVDKLYARRYHYDVNDLDTDSSVVYTMNTIEKIQSYFKCIHLAEYRANDSVPYYFIKYLLIDLNQNGRNKDSLKNKVKNFNELFIKVTGISIDSINYDTTLWGYLWHRQFDLYFKQFLDRDNDGIPDLNAYSSGPKSPAFPWPPPKPTASIKTEKFNSKNLKTFGDASKKIKTTLSKQGYGEWRYYSVPGGFAMVAPMEQIVEQGKPAETPPRWDTKVSLSDDFSWGGYFKALFFGDRGNYRVMVFIITDQDLVVSKKQLSLSGMNSLMTQGGLDLTNSEKKLKYSEEHNCYILIYEFEKRNDGEPASFKPKGYTAQQHLQNTKLWKSFF